MFGSTFNTLRARFRYLAQLPPGQHRNATEIAHTVEAQTALAHVLNRTPPEALAVLNAELSSTTRQMRESEFGRLIDQWCQRSSRLHAPDRRPSRRFRKFQYLAVLEYGPNSSRLHAHLAIWQLHDVPLESLAEQWRQVSRIARPNEPWLRRYDPERDGLGYVLKSWDGDAITFMSAGLASILRAARQDAR